MAQPEPAISASALKRRDRCAWNQAYDLHVGDVYAFVFHLVRGNRSLAEDLNQETWLEALDAIEQFSPDRGELRGWLLGIARNRVAMHYRRQFAQATTHPGDDGMLALQDDLDRPLLPDDIVERVERQGVVRAALVSLDSDCRNVLIAKYVDGLSVAQIAARVARTPKAVESLLSRARARLRSLLRWYFPSNTRDDVS
jgi:RNA polymerase sigma-70 factor (ECF subfamily)